MQLSQSTQSGFPNINIPDKEKNDSWHKQAVEAITNNTLNASYTINYVSMNQSVNFFQGTQTGDEYKFLQEAQDGDVLPAKWMNLNRIRPKLSTVIGEFMEKGYDIEAKAINTEAVSKKLAAKETLRVKMRMKPASQALEQQIGLPFQGNDYVPENDEELEYYMSAQYKETSEFIMESALKWLAKKFNWDYLRMQLFADILIMGRCFAKVEIVDGLPVIRRVDPRLMIFDTNATNDYLTDSTYFGEVRYMPLAEAIDVYKLTNEEIEEIKTSTKNTTGATTITSAFNQGFITNNDNQIIYYKQDSGGLRVLVVTGYWMDTKPYNHRVDKNEYGTEYIKQVPETEKGKNVEKRRIKIWRKGTVIAGKILKEWGEMENQVRDVDNLCETYPPYVACIPFFMNGTGTSIVQLLKPLQDLKDITMYNISLAMSRAGAKGFVYDISQIPDDMTFEQMVKYLKVVGISIIDSKKDGMPSQFNQFQTFDLSLSESVGQYLAIMQMIDTEMDAISGVNEARQGQAAGASQAVGVTQSLLMQSNFSTAPLFKLYRMFASKCFNIQAKMVKLAWAGKEKFAAVIGDTGVDFLAQDIELDLQDYGVFVSEVPPMIDDINTFKQFVMASLQAGTLEFIDALELMQEKDIKIATRKYRKAVEKKEEKAAKQEQAMAQQQQQAQIAAQQAQMQAQAQMAQQDAQNKQLMEQQKGANKLKNTFAQGKIDLAGKKIDLLKK